MSHRTLMECRIQNLVMEQQKQILDSKEMISLMCAGYSFYSSLYNDASLSIPLNDNKNALNCDGIERLHRSLKAAKKKNLQHN
mmetsp:Transcript_23265/g.46376  ORF Transcript_23265/g.46376 Transcript_23265/m.46376 type:complete len:83 (-) Transcript_23265:3-251(-)